jgi:flagellar biogenesis protein FliO
MLINRCRSCSWLRLACRLAVFCVILLTCSIALSQEKRPTGEFAGVETASSQQEPPVQPADSDPTSSPELPSIEPPPTSSAEPTGAEQPVEALPPDETLESSISPDIAPSGPDALQIPSPLTDRTEGEPFGADWLNARESAWKMFVALLIVLALICISVFVLKRVMGGRPVFLDQRLGRVIGRIHLSPKAVLYLVKIGGKVLVVGTTPTAITLVAEVTDPEIVSQMEGTRRAPPGSVRAPFAGRLGRLFSKFGEEAQPTVEEDARFEDYLRDIKGQMEKLSALMGGAEDEEEL